MTQRARVPFAVRGRIGQQAMVAFALMWAACGIKTGLRTASENSGDNGSSPTGTAGTSNTMVGGSGGNVSSQPANGGSTASSRGGSGGNGSGGRDGGSAGNGPGGNASGGGSVGRDGGASDGVGRDATGGTTTMFRDAALADGRVSSDASRPGTPVVDPNSGYVTLSTGTVVMSGYVASNAGGSGSSISLTCTDNSFCASGTVGASPTYNSWANTGFSVNQKQSGGSGSTGALALVGTTMSISYENRGGSGLELVLWDNGSSRYWCYYLPPATGPTTATVPLTKLNTQCWDNSGLAFESGTAISMVQLAVPGSSTQVTPFDYCFLGLTVQ